MPKAYFFYLLGVLFTPITRTWKNYFNFLTNKKERKNKKQRKKKEKERKKERKKGGKKKEQRHEVNRAICFSPFLLFHPL
jgi:CBS domain containing-hemolysin-like protein